MNTEARRLRDWPKNHNGKVAGRRSRFRPERQPAHHSIERKSNPAAPGGSFPWHLTWLRGTRPRQLALGPVSPRAVLSPATTSAQPQVTSRSAAFQSPRSHHVTRRCAQPPGKCSASFSPLGQLLSRQSQTEVNEFAQRPYPTLFHRFPYSTLEPSRLQPQLHHSAPAKNK